MRRIVVRRFAVLLILCALALPVAAARAWTWPVDGPVLRPFSFDRAHPYAGGQHRGVDLGAPTGTPVLAPSEGVVSFAGTVPGGGKTVSIQTPSALTATLVHLGSIGVMRGTLVQEGAAVGTVGPSGDVEGDQPYVYFGVRRTSDAQGYVDPLTVLPPRAVISPAPTPDVEVPAAESPVAGEAAPEAPRPPVEIAGEAPAEPAGEAASSAEGDAQADASQAPVPVRKSAKPHNRGVEPAPVHVETPAAPAETPTTEVRRGPSPAAASALGSPRLGLHQSRTGREVKTSSPNTGTRSALSGRGSVTKAREVQTAGDLLFAL